MKKIRLWLPCLFMFMFLMQIDAQAQEFVKYSKVITTQEDGNTSSFISGDDHYHQSEDVNGPSQLAQAGQMQSSQKRTIKFKPPADSPKEARKAKQKYKSGQFKRPKQHPRNKK